MGAGKAFLSGLALTCFAVFSLGALAQDSEDLEEVLAAMEAAGLVPSSEERMAWTEPTVTRESGHRTGPVFQGRVRLRGYQYAPDVFRQDHRLDLLAGHLGLKARLADRGDGSNFQGGAVDLDWKSCRVILGYTGLQAGFGLLLAGPGRGGSPTADSSFPRPGTRLAVWTSTPDANTVKGGTLQARWRGLAVAALLGKGEQVGQASNIVETNVIALTSTLSATLSGPRSRLGLAGLKTGTGQGLSFWGWREQGFLEASGECAIWQESPGVASGFSWQAVTSLRPNRAWHFQGALAQAGGQARSPLGRRSSFQRGDEGLGWAIRSRWSDQKGLQLALLAAGSQSMASHPYPRREQSRVWDLIAGLKLPSGVRLDGRLRSFSGNRWLWDDRFPWKPAVLDRVQGRVQGKLGLTWERGADRLAAAGRWLQTAENGESARRVLAQLDFRRTLRPWLRLRGAYGSAWADPIDLVSAISPVPGLVLPRHWGSWKSETFLGIGVQTRGLDIWFGASRRLPYDREGQPTSWQGWLETRAEW